MWIYKGREYQFNEPFLCMIYKIVLRDGRYYYGKKDLTDKRGKHITPMNYYSSSDYIKEYIKTNGKESVTRYILYLCKSKTAARYIEEKILFMSDALLDKNCLNKNIGGRWYTKTIEDNYREIINVRRDDI